jgi:hypothetical protein
MKRLLIIAAWLFVGIVLGLGALEFIPPRWDNIVRFAALLALIALVLCPWPSRKDKK